MRLHAENLPVDFVTWLRAVLHGHRRKAATAYEVDNDEVAVELAGGTPQGCPASPLIWTIVADYALAVLRAKSDGAGEDVRFGGEVLRALAFADDLAVVARTREGLRRMVQLLVAAIGAIGVRFNARKSYYVLPPRRPRRAGPVGRALLPIRCGRLRSVGSVACLFCMPSDRVAFASPHWHCGCTTAELGGDARWSDLISFVVRYDEQRAQVGGASRGRGLEPLSGSNPRGVAHAHGNRLDARRLPGASSSAQAERAQASSTRRWPTRSATSHTTTSSPSAACPPVRRSPPSRSPTHNGR